MIRYTLVMMKQKRDLLSLSDYKNNSCDTWYYEKGYGEYLKETTSPSG